MSEALDCRSNEVMISVAMVKISLVAALLGLAMFAVHRFLELAGWQVSLGFALGAILFYCLFRMHYGWWPDFNADGDDDQNRKLPRL